MVSGLYLANKFHQLPVNVSAPSNAAPDLSAALLVMPNYLPNSMFLTPTDGCEIYTEIVNPKTTRSLDVENLQVKPLKYVADILDCSLAYI